LPMLGPHRGVNATDLPVRGTSTASGERSPVVVGRGVKAILCGDRRWRSSVGGRDPEEEKQSRSWVGGESTVSQIFGCLHHRPCLGSYSPASLATSQGQKQSTSGRSGDSSQASWNRTCAAVSTSGGADRCCPRSSSSITASARIQLRWRINVRRWAVGSDKTSFAPEGDSRMPRASAWMPQRRSFPRCRVKNQIVSRGLRAASVARRVGGEVCFIRLLSAESRANPDETFVFRFCS
jgi:hypothetical protein